MSDRTVAEIEVTSSASHTDVAELLSAVDETSLRTREQDNGTVEVVR